MGEADGSYFCHFEEFVARALADAPQPAELAGMFWLQGESDSGGNAAVVNAHEERLSSFLTQCRVTFNAPSLPFVASPIVWKGKKVQRINNSIRQACENPALQPAICSKLD